jgi:hypothetical protein
MHDFSAFPILHGVFFQTQKNAFASDFRCWRRGAKNRGATPRLN